MTRARLAVLTCFLLLPCSLHAQFPSSLTPQQRPPASTNPTARVRGWYRQFFNREMDRGALRWINDLQRGVDPNQVLAQILSSDEYYQLAGSTPEGFVRQLFDDLRGREPTRDELRDWTRRLQTLKREQVALALIREGPGPQPPTPPADADYFAELEDAIRRVGDKLEDLSDDIVDELEGKRERELVRRTEAVTDELRAFQRVARPGMPRDRMERAFDKFDRSLDELLEAVRRAAGGRGTLRRSADHVAQADQRLHLAFFANQQPPDRPNPSLLRETEALLAQGKQLQKTAVFVLADLPAGNAIRRNLNQFVERAERFRGSVKDGADIQRLRRDFAATVDPWSAAVRGINDLPPAGGYYLLRVQAQRVEQVGVWLQRQLQAKLDIPFITMPTPPGKR